jgi:hypothetical protein
MTGNEYFGLLRTLRWTHVRAAEFLGVSKWTSIAWRNNRQQVPKMVELALRSEIYWRLSGPTINDAVDAVVGIAKGSAPHSKPYERAA